MTMRSSPPYHRALLALLAVPLLLCACDSGDEDTGGFTEPVEITIRVTGTEGLPFSADYRAQTFETCKTVPQSTSRTVPFETTVTANAAEITAVHQGASGQLLRVEVERNGVVLSDQTNVDGDRVQAGFPFERSCP